MSCNQVGGPGTHVAIGWGCCACHVYNGDHRIWCKRCCHARCDVDNPPDDFERPKPKPQINIADESLVKGGKDCPADGQLTLGEICEMVADRIDGDDENGASDVLDVEILAGGWANAFKVLKDNHVQYTELARDIRGLAIAMYSLGRQRERDGR